MGSDFARRISTNEYLPGSPYLSVPVGRRSRAPIGVAVSGAARFEFRLAASSAREPGNRPPTAKKTRWTGARRVSRLPTPGVIPHRDFSGVGFSADMLHSVCTLPGARSMRLFTDMTEHVAVTRQVEGKARTRALKRHPVPVGTNRESAEKSLHGSELTDMSTCPINSLQRTRTPLARRPYEP
jgi:hypothetical protein